MTTFCLVVSGIAGFYRRFFPDENHVVQSVRTSDIIIGTIASMTEPDGMMWFPRFNAGETVIMAPAIACQYHYEGNEFTRETIL